MEEITAENKLPTDLNQLTVEIKFYVNQWGENTIEIGRRLIAAKELVEHGDWQNWLEENFNLKERSAQNFIAVAERFGNFQTSGNLKFYQMVELLALPAEENENFIAEKAAEGTPVEEMTVKNLREEVAKYKAEFEQEKAKVENLFGEKSELERKNSILQKNYDGIKQADNDKRDTINKLTIEKNNLEQQLQNQKTIEKLPEDYEPLKKEREQLQNKIAQLQRQLQEKPIDIQVPADYESNKKQLAELQAKYEAMEKCAVLVQTFKTISQQIHSIIYSEYLGKALAYFQKTDATSFNQMKIMVDEFQDSINEE